MKVKKWISGLMVTCLGLLSLATANAQTDLKPVAAVSVAGYNSILKGLEKEFQLAGFEETFSALSMMVGDIECLDLDRPAGIVVMTDDKKVIPFGFLPVTDLDQFPFINDNLYDKETGLLTLNDSDDDDSNNLVLRLIQQNGWVFVSQPEFADQIPVNDDPTPLLEGMNGKYLFGAKIYPNNVSMDLVETLMAPIRQKAALSSDDFAKNFEAFTKAFNYLKSVSDSLEFGLTIQTGNGDLVFSGNVTPKEGSSLKESIELNKDLKTRWLDFYQPENACLVMTETEIADQATIDFQLDNMKSCFDQKLMKHLSIEDEEARQEAEKALEEMKPMMEQAKEIFLDNIAMGKSDSAMTFRNDGMFMLGGTITSGEKVTALIASLTDYIKGKITESAEANEDEDAKETVEKVFKSLKVNANNFEGYSVSTFVITKDVCEYAAGLSILLAVKDDALILLAGPSKKEVAELFKEKASMERKEEAAPKETFRLSIPETSKFVQSLMAEDSDQIAQMVVENLAESDANALIVAENPSPVEGTLTIKGEVFTAIGETVQSLFNSDDEDVDEEDAELFDDEN